LCSFIRNHCSFEYNELAMKRSVHICFFALLLIPGFFLLSGCGGDVLKEVDTPTTGKIKVGVDDSYKLLFDAELFTFQTLYKYSRFDTLIRSEADIIDLFMKDSIPLMIVNRTLTKEEEKFLNERQIIPKTTMIAYDGIAFIVNKENPDTNLFYDQIAGIFTGKLTSWKQINQKRAVSDSVKIIFDNYRSGNPRYLKEKFNIDKLPAACYAVNNNAEVINFVEKHKNAIGVISVNWVSDKADTVSHGFLNRIKIVRVSPPGNNDPAGSFYSPHPGYIATGSYPFTRKVYCINRQTYSGLAYGLSSFIAGEKGQLIVLHSGLVPAAEPVRLVEIKH